MGVQDELHTVYVSTLTELECPARGFNQPERAKTILYTRCMNIHISLMIHTCILL